MRAVELYNEEWGRASVAFLLGIPGETVRKWLGTYRSAGIEVLAMVGKRETTHSFETKLAAVRAVEDEGGGQARGHSEIRDSLDQLV